MEYQKKGFKLKSFWKFNPNFTTESREIWNFIFKAFTCGNWKPITKGIKNK